MNCLSHIKKLAFFMLFFLAQLAVQAATQTEVWVARYNGPANGVDSPTALAVDSAGNVYVTGGSTESSTGFEDYATIKYDPYGNRLWVSRYNGPANFYDSSTALAVDSDGNVYVTGYSLGSGTGYDYATIKYDSNGNQLWVSRYNGPTNDDDSSAALAVDSDGNVYVTGYSLESSTGYDYTTIKYDSNGNQLWVSHYNGPANSRDMATALAVDNAGNVYVTGNSMENVTSYEEDYATIKYDPNGNQLWVSRYNGPANADDSPSALAVDGAGNVYVTGYSPSVTSYDDYATIKYDPNGNQLWVSRYNGPGNSEDMATALAVDNAGNVYVTGGSWSVTSYDYATIKYGPDGNQRWVSRYSGLANADNSPTALAVDNAGNVYVTGRSTGSSGTSYDYDDYATIKYDPNGNQLWVSRYNGPANGSDVATALAVDNAGNVYVTGGSIGSGTYIDYATIKYSQSPTQTIQTAITLVQQLPLGSGQKTSLTSKLNAVARYINQGDIADACSTLIAAINEVNALVRSGQLNAANAASLLNEIQASQRLLGCS